jgi:hypothetical protein
MWLNNGSLKFRVIDGHSETWNNFGNEDMLLSVPTSLTRLNSYLPAVSLTESQVNYAENRVISLTLSLIATSRRVALRPTRGLPRDHPRKRQTSRKAGTQSHRAFRVRHACIAMRMAAWPPNGC